MLRRVNEALFPNIPANMFVTCFYAILDPKSGLLSYANAGHDLPYLWHGGETEELFGFPRLRELVAEHGEEGALGDFLMEELYSFVGEGWEQEDDITLLTIERSELRS